MKIYIREVYSDYLDELSEFIDKYLEPYSNVYWCRYSSLNDANIVKNFIRIGFLDPKKKQIDKFDKDIAKRQDKVLYTYKWIEHPKTKEYDMELMKFLAYYAVRDIQNHFKLLKKYYEKSPMRQRDMYGRPFPKEKRASMTTMDWHHYLHHLFNMLQLDYQDEIYLLNSLSNGLLYNQHKSLNRQVFN